MDKPGHSAISTGNVWHYADVARRTIRVNMAISGGNGGHDNNVLQNQADVAMVDRVTGTFTLPVIGMLH